MSPVPSATPKNPEGTELWNRALEIEKKLRNVLRKKSFYDVEARSTRQELRVVYADLLFADFRFAHEADIEQLLWKSVYYRTIEEFRSRIRLSANAGEQGKQSHAKVSAAFSKFLQEATAFYEGLIDKLQRTFANSTAQDNIWDAQLPAQHEVSSSQQPAAEQLKLSVHRCLIYLGDLARYHAQVLGPSKKQDWKRATSYYKRAATVCPNSGNPFNQLAVMAYYTNDELRAVYYYFRSLAVQVPFQTAHENLVMLFEKNRAKYAALPSTFQPQASTAVSSASSTPSLAHELAIRFVRLHAILYDRINSEQLPQVQEAAFACLTAFLNDSTAAEQLSKAPPHDQPLVHLAVSCVYAAHKSQQRAAAASARAGPNSQSEVQMTSSLASQSFSVLLQYLTALMTHALPSNPAALAAAYTLLSWLTSQQNLILASLLPAFPVRSFFRALHDFSSAALEQAKASSISGPFPLSAHLPEEKELEGFQPLGWDVPAAAAASVQSPSTNHARLSKFLSRAGKAQQLLSTLQPYITGADVISTVTAYCTKIQYTISAYSQPPAVIPGPGLPPMHPTPVSRPSTAGRDDPMAITPPATAAASKDDGDDEEEEILFKPRRSRSNIAVSPPESMSGFPLDAYANDSNPSTRRHAPSNSIDALPVSARNPHALSDPAASLSQPSHAWFDALTALKNRSPDTSGLQQQPQQQDPPRPSSGQQPHDAAQDPHAFSYPASPWLPSTSLPTASYPNIAAPTPQHPTPSTPSNLTEYDDLLAANWSNIVRPTPHRLGSMPPPSSSATPMSITPNQAQRPPDFNRPLSASSWQQHTSGGQPLSATAATAHGMQRTSSGGSSGQMQWQLGGRQASGGLVDSRSSTPAANAPVPWDPHGVPLSQIRMQSGSSNSIAVMAGGGNVAGTSGGFRPGGYGTVQRPGSAMSDREGGLANHPGVGVGAGDVGMSPSPGLSPVPGGQGAGYHLVTGMSMDMPLGASSLGTGAVHGNGVTGASEGGLSGLSHQGVGLHGLPAGGGSMFGTLFDGKDMFHHVRQPSGSGAGSGTSTPVHAAADHVFQEQMFSNQQQAAGSSAGRAFPSPALHTMPAQQPPHSLAQQSYPASMGYSTPQPPAMLSMPQAQPQAQPPQQQLQGAFSFIDMLQEQQQQQQQHYASTQQRPSHIPSEQQIAQQHFSNLLQQHRLQQQQPQLHVLEHLHQQQQAQLQQHQLSSHPPNAQQYPATIRNIQSPQRMLHQPQQQPRPQLQQSLQYPPQGVNAMGAGVFPDSLLQFDEIQYGMQAGGGLGGRLQFPLQPTTLAGAVYNNAAMGFAQRPSLLPGAQH